MKQDTQYYIGDYQAPPEIISIIEDGSLSEFERFEALEQQGLDCLTAERLLPEPAEYYQYVMENIKYHLGISNAPEWDDKG